MLQRRSLIIYFQNADFFKTIDKGMMSVYYISEKNKYAVVYFDAAREKSVRKYLDRYKDITSIEESLLEVENIKF